MVELYVRLSNWLREEKGQGMVEYVLILVLISVVAIAIMTTVGNDVKGVFSQVATALGT